MFGMGLNLGFGDSARSAGGGGPTEEEDMATLTKIITRAELNALGSDTFGVIPFDKELPAGSYPVAMHARNLGTAFTGTGVSDLEVAIVGQTYGVNRMHEAGLAGRANLLDGIEGAGDGPPQGAPGDGTGDLWPHEGGQPLIACSLGSSGVDFDGVTGGDDGIEVVLVYAKKIE
jgi:hypothetical protein